MPIQARHWLWSIAALLLALAGPQANAGPTLDGIRGRGTLTCGVNIGIAGFSIPDSQGIWRGLDADLCRAVAAALFGDAGKVRFVPLTGVQRFTALQSGEIDVLIRQTTFTLARDASLGLRMMAPYLYDGHAFMVRRDANITDPRQMDGMTICMPLGTTNELITAGPLLGQALKLDPAREYNAVRAVGNYGELFDRDLGPHTPIGLERGMNNLHTNGGIMYAWPMR